MAFVFTLDWAGVSIVLEAPSLALASTANDPRPDFDVGIPVSALAGDVIRVQADSADYVSHTLTSGDFTAPTIAKSGIAVLSDGAHVFRARMERGSSVSPWSNDVSGTIDTSAPVLSGASGNTQSPTTATLSVSTNKSGGVLYWVVTASSTKPTAAQVKAGQNNTGSAALSSGSQAVTATGVQNVFATDLTTAGARFGHFMQEDTSSNQSAVATTLSWTQIGGTWSPADLLPALWIDVSDAATRFQLIAGTSPATTDGQSVGYLSDKSGNAFHLTATGDDSTRPVLGGTGLYPYLTFDGVDDKLRRVANLGLYTAGSHTIFVAARGVSPVASRVLVAETNNTGLAELIICHNTTASSGSALYRDDTGGIVILNPGSFEETGTWDNTDNVFGIADNGALVTSYLDGVSHDSLAYTRLVNNPVPTKFCLGAELRTSGGGFFPGRLYALVAVKRVISDTERTRLVTWLAAKVGRVL